MTFPSVSSLSEEGGNKPPKRQFLNKKDSLNYLFFLEFWMDTSMFTQTEDIYKMKGYKNEEK